MATATHAAVVTRTLGSICDEVGGIIRTGPFGSQLHESDYAEIGIPVVMPKNILDGRVSAVDIARVGDEHVDRLSQHKLRAGDIIYGRRGDIGRRALITARESGWLCGTGCLRISLGTEVIDPLYLYYYLGQPLVIQWVANQAIGATLPNLNTDILRSVEVSYPPLPTQRKIAAVLSAYDNLIANNTRRIALLEEMARSLYHEWFVRFRYPGHAAAHLVDSSLGPIPGGWGVARLGDIARVNPESLSRGDEPELIHYVDIASVSPGRIDRVETLELAQAPGRARRVVRHGDIVWSTVRPNRKSYSLIMRPPENLVVSTGFAVIRGKLVPYSYLFQTLGTDDFAAYLASRAKGSAYPAVAVEDFEDAAVLLPTTHLLDRFHAIVEPMLMAREAIMARNENLRQTRDLLLPKLVSGAVDVGNLRIEMGEVMA